MSKSAKVVLMSVTLYVLVVLQGTSLSFSPGYTTAAERLQQYKGPNVAPPKADHP